MKLQIHSLLWSISGANGPGKRLVIFTQGCILNCRGCWNPDTHPFRGGQTASAEDIIKELIAGNGNGITFSGGEPIFQIRAVSEICKSVRQFGLDSLLFTGFTPDELRAYPAVWKAISYIDTVFAGPPNQKTLIIFRKPVLPETDRVEVIIDESAYYVTGFPEKKKSRR